MIIHNNIEFHNVVELEPRNVAHGGVQLQRIPKTVRNQLNARGRWNSQCCIGSELRFVSDASHVRVFISALEGDELLLVFCGDILHAKHYITPGKVHCIHLETPSRFADIKPGTFSGMRFAPQVWRIMTAGYSAVFHEIETFGHDWRPPLPEEKPQLRWLAYGSSITAGSGTSTPDLSYPQLAARLLGVDVYNLAMGGACYCEPELADFMAVEAKWDFATLEIGVNMRDTFSPTAFKKRATYMLETMLRANPGKPIVLISPFVNFSNNQQTPTDAYVNQLAYEKILTQLEHKHRAENVHLFDGRKLLGQFNGFNSDLIHPADFGHNCIAHSLVIGLKPIIRQLRTAEGVKYYEKP